MHAVEFREQISGCIGNRTQWILGMRVLPGGKRLVRRAEVEVVHLTITGIESAIRCCRSVTRLDPHKQSDQHKQHGCRGRSMAMLSKRQQAICLPNQKSEAACLVVTGC